jgi:hypothetical protein
MKEYSRMDNPETQPRLGIEQSTQHRTKKMSTTDSIKNQG